MKPFDEFLVEELLPALGETLKMVGVAGLISSIIGIFIGILLFSFNPQRGLVKNKYVYAVFSFLTNCIRSIPFLILGVLLIPLTMFITGIYTRPTFFGSDASIIPLTIASTAFIAKLVENSFIEVNDDIIEAGKSLGMSRIQIITHILLKEALPSICNGICVAMVSLLGISAVVEAWAGGGLGALAVSLGIEQGRNIEMIYIVIVIIILVVILNTLGNTLYKHLMYGGKMSGLKKAIIPLLIIFLIPIVGVVGYNRNSVVIGTMQTPGYPILDYIEPMFEAKGYHLKIDVFNKFELGNKALGNGSIQGNLFQHRPYLDTQNEDGQFSVACEMYYPVFGGYSESFILAEGETLATKLPKDKQIKIAIPKDDSNRTRALNLLKAEGIITFVDSPIVKLSDVQTGDYNILFEDVPSDQIPAAIKHGTVDLGIVSNSHAALAGLGSEQLIITESYELQHRNVNVFVVRTEDLNKKWVKDLVDVLISDETTEFINEKFGGTLIPLPKSCLPEE